jgi:hypothetical protein
MYNFCYHFSTSHYLQSLYLVFGHYFQLLLLCDYNGSQAIKDNKALCLTIHYRPNRTILNY